MSKSSTKAILCFPPFFISRPKLSFLFFGSSAYILFNLSLTFLVCKREENGISFSGIVFKEFKDCFNSINDVCLNSKYLQDFYTFEIINMMIRVKVI